MSGIRGTSADGARCAGSRRARTARPPRVARDVGPLNVVHADQRSLPATLSLRGWTVRRKLIAITAITPTLKARIRRLRR